MVAIPPNVSGKVINISWGCFDAHRAIYKLHGSRGPELWFTGGQVSEIKRVGGGRRREVDGSKEITEKNWWVNLLTKGLIFYRELVMTLWMKKQLSLNSKDFSRRWDQGSKESGLCVGISLSHCWKEDEVAWRGHSHCSYTDKTFSGSDYGRQLHTRSNLAARKPIFREYFQLEKESIEALL